MDGLGHVYQSLSVQQQGKLLGQTLLTLFIANVQALPLLSSVVLLLLIFVFLFGVAGTQLFQGAAHQVCVNNVDGSYPDPQPTENSDEWGCGHRLCPSNYTCTVSHSCKCRVVHQE